MPMEEPPLLASKKINRLNYLKLFVLVKYLDFFFSFHNVTFNILNDIFIYRNEIIIDAIKKVHPGKKYLFRISEAANTIWYCSMLT